MSGTVLILVLSIGIGLGMSCSKSTYTEKKPIKKGKIEQTLKKENEIEKQPIKKSEIEKPLTKKSEAKKTITSKQEISGWLDLSKKLTLAELISAIASIATMLSTLLTYFLLKETQRTLKLSVKIADRDSKRLEAEMINLIYRNFRDTYLSMINDKAGIKVLADSQGKRVDDMKVSMHASFLINNVHEIYNLYKKGFVTEDVWQNFRVDIEDFFSFPFIKKRWLEIKGFYPVKFQLFVTALIKDDSNQTN